MLWHENSLPLPPCRQQYKKLSQHSAPKDGWPNSPDEDYRPSQYHGGQPDERHCECLLSEKQMRKTTELQCLRSRGRGPEATPRVFAFIKAFARRFLRTPSLLSRFVVRWRQRNRPTAKQLQTPVNIPLPLQADASMTSSNQLLPLTESGWCAHHW